MRINFSKPKIVRLMSNQGLTSITHAPVLSNLKLQTTIQIFYDRITRRKKAVGSQAISLKKKFPCPADPKTFLMYTVIHDSNNSILRGSPEGEVFTIYLLIVILSPVGSTIYAGSHFSAEED